MYCLSVKTAVRVLRCTRQNCKDVTPEGTPKGIAETLRYDDPQRQLQFHTGTKGGAGKRPAMFHGQGVGIDDEKENLLRYCSEIEKSLHAFFGQDDAPVILAGVEPLLPLYRQVSVDPHLLDQDIDHNPDELTNEMLHRRGWELAEKHFENVRQQSVARFLDMAGTGMTSSDVKEIVLQSRYGRVENLFVNTDVQQWGLFHEETGNVTFHERQEPWDQDLMNTAALNTLSKGGTVHALKRRIDAGFEPPLRCFSLLNCRSCGRNTHSPLMKRASGDESCLMGQVSLISLEDNMNGRPVDSWKVFLKDTLSERMNVSETFGVNDDPVYIVLGSFKNIQQFLGGTPVKISSQLEV